MKILAYIGMVTIGIIALIIILVVVRFIWFNLIKKYIYPSLQNLWVAMFGIRELKGKYLSTWLKYYAHKPGVRKHFKSWRNFKRLAYRKLVLEAKKELHAGVVVNDTYRYGCVGWPSK